MAVCLRKAEIICAGTELLSGKLNSYPPLFAEKLKEAGFRVERAHCVRDSLRDISETVAEALKRSDAVIVCGGMGPTFDDVTREGVADALQRKLLISQTQLRILRKKFLRFGIRMPAINEKQALRLEGAGFIPNIAGSAPGQILALKKPRKILVLLPGPINEWEPMFKMRVLPVLRRTFPGAVQRKTLILRIAGMSESAAQEALQPVLDSFADIDFTILAGQGTVDFFITASAKTKKACLLKLEIARRRCKALLGSAVYGGKDDSLESVTGRQLLRKKWTLSIAESCTGGLISHRITEVPGSSRYFTGALAAYSNEIKKKLLNIKKATLEKYGAVSAECALEMARGARKLFRTDCALAVTGIAGPSGGSRKKPVGTVFTAVSSPSGERCIRKVFRTNRSGAKQRAAVMALDLLRISF
ncbi:MAG: CinA family nicotinamide mononucleotide deamidase-related protein [bacterium]